MRPEAAARPRVPSPARAHPSARPGRSERSCTRAFWAGRRVLISDGSGPLGSRLVEQVRALGGQALTPAAGGHDLTARVDVRRLFEESRPSVVLHVAAAEMTGAREHPGPGAAAYGNLLMGINVIEEARRAGVEKLVLLGSSSAASTGGPGPGRAGSPMRAHPGAGGAPDPFGNSALLMQLHGYRARYGLRGIYLVPADLYGAPAPADPRFGRAVPAMIATLREAAENGARQVGLGGAADLRCELLHVSECARGILLAAEHYDAPAAVNLGPGGSVTLRVLSGIVAREVGFRGRIGFVEARPAWAPARRLGARPALPAFGFRNRIPLAEGLREMVITQGARRTPDGRPEQPVLSAPAC